MLRSKHTATLIGALIVFFASTQTVFAWNFVSGTLNAPYNQCQTCHTSSGFFPLNPYGQDYLSTASSHASRYASKHRGKNEVFVMTSCSGGPGLSNCHNQNTSYPIINPNLNDAGNDSDQDGFSNPTELSQGTWPGDATSFPSDNTAPTITAFSVPATSMTLSVAVTSFSATDDVAVTGYMVTDNGNAPLASDQGWSASAPNNYTCASAANYTLYGWAKDAAGNVSAAATAPVDTTPSSQRTNDPPVAAAGMDQTVEEGSTVILNAMASTDDLGIITYAWVQLDGTGGNAIVSSDPSAVILSDADAITPTFVAPAVAMTGATLTFRLTVTDGDNASASDEIDIVVSDNGVIDFDGMPGVVSTVTINGDPIGISAGGANACIQLSTMSVGDFGSSGATQPENMIYGVVDFELLVTDPANCSITIHLAAPAPAGYKWYKHTDARGWFDFDRDLISNGTGEGAVFNADRTAVTLYIDDNSEFDGNPADGVIQDPGGLGFGTTTAISVGSNSFGGSSGGGCFIMTSADRN